VIQHGANPFTQGAEAPVHLSGVRPTRWSLPHAPGFQLGAPAPPGPDGWLRERQEMQVAPAVDHTAGLLQYWATRGSLSAAGLALAHLAISPVTIAPATQKIIRVGALARALTRLGL